MTTTSSTALEAHVLAWTKEGGLTSVSQDMPVEQAQRLVETLREANDPAECWFTLEAAG